MSDLFQDYYDKTGLLHLGQFNKPPPPPAPSPIGLLNKQSRGASISYDQISDIVGALHGMYNKYTGKIEGTNPSYQLPGSNGASGFNPISAMGANLGVSSSGGNPDIDRLVNAVGKEESGLNYSAIGPRTKSGDRAYGFSQVMGYNVPVWTQQVLGKRMSPEEYLADPEAQMKVTRAILGGYLNKYGNADDAMSTWFSGRPMKGNTSRDILGTTVPGYVAGVRRYY